EDDLMRIFGGDRIGSVMERLSVDDETPIENRIISKSLEAAQKKVEGHNFDQRKNVVKYDDVMNRHRKATYTMRREILNQPDISKRIRIFVNEEAKDLANSPLATSEHYEAILKEVFPFSESTLDKLFDLSAEKFEIELRSEAVKLYETREKLFGAEDFRKIERDIYLQILDNLWMQHLENMDHLREGIHWISVGQRDPLVEYRRQGQQMFEEMQQALRHDVIRAIFNAEPADVDQAPTETELTRAARQSVDNADKIIEADEFSEEDFVSSGAKKGGTKKVVSSASRKKAHKQERKRRKKAKKNKKR
ncbi:preprotein translocase subunit SecA, partial [Candidatus Saccharibacteria bacterium]|nr:preprotein translocase subunit SecA [Candidatus Saccharibacteria bacterium]